MRINKLKSKFEVLSEIFFTNLKQIFYHITKWGRLSVTTLSINKQIKNIYITNKKFLYHNNKEIQFRAIRYLQIQRNRQY